MSKLYIQDVTLRDGMHAIRHRYSIEQVEPGGTKESFKFRDPDGFLVQLNGPEYEGHVGNWPAGAARNRPAWSL